MTPEKHGPGCGNYAESVTSKPTAKQAQAKQKQLHAVNYMSMTSGTNVHE
jgi:hypothetical protein